MKTTRYAFLVLMAITCVVLTQVSVLSQTAKKPDAELETMRRQMIDRGVAYLRSQQQENGAFTTNPRSGIGQTAVATVGLLKVGIGPDDPTVKKAIDYLMTFAKDSGAFASPGERIVNYETCVVMLALSLANNGGVYDEILKRSDAFLRGQQYTEANGISPDDSNYGGVGYGNAGRADLSNTEFLIEALRITSKGADDPAIQKALVFVSRCQNLESEHNNSPKVPKNPDGGFYYTAENGGESSAGETANGGLRSYGSMTYAGFKSLIYAGLTTSDPRYRAAESWLKKNYDIESNPGMGQRGLFYYYQMMAKTLTVTGWKTFVSDDGTEHDWRAELIEMLALRQREDGSWVNSEPMWMENDPGLVTGFVLMVLGECKVSEK
jgi:squalene-hopene/tetraprenyl-beta-curcumene cyclase